MPPARVRPSCTRKSYLRFRGDKISEAFSGHKNGDFRHIFDRNGQVRGAPAIVGLCVVLCLKL